MTGPGAVASGAADVVPDGAAGSPGALGPVREFLLRDARREAARLIADAHREADGIVAAARRSGDDAVDRARAQGQATGAARAAIVRAEGREAAAAILLRARREVLDELRSRITTAIGALRDDPELLGRLSALAAGAAGSGAVVAGAPAGGVVARAGSVLVDCSLPRIASLAADALDGEVRELWTR